MPTAQEYQEQGLTLFKQKEYEAASRAFQQAHEAYEVDGERTLAGEMQANIGLVHRALGENQQALDAMQASLSIFQELEDALRAAKALGNIGGVYAALGDREQAYTCYRNAADVFQELGENKLYGETLLAMGDLQVREGKLMAGASTYEVGLEQLGELTATQRVLKGLIGIRNKIMGGGTPAS
ncbi:MAG: tetratricopeptide repeat protein [Anaerolineae bacterium]|nr:tetratricopeptide repeat protein [Anaerolineae bacterium]